MGFYTGTIDGGGSAGLQTKIEDCLALESAYWAFVEECTVSTKTYRVWKNKGHAWAGNAEFFFFFTQINATTLTIRPFEEWNSETKKCTGMISAASSGNVTLDSLGRFPEADPTQTSNGAVYINSIPSSSTYTYYIGIGPQGIYVAISTMTDTFYMGLYEPSGIYASGEFPLVVLTFVNSTSHRFSRIPGLTGSQNYSVLVANIAHDSIGAIPTGLAQLANKSLLSRRRVSDIYGIVRGLCPAWMLVSAVPAAGVVRGDTITIGGVTHTLVGGGSYGHHWIASNT